MYSQTYSLRHLPSSGDGNVRREIRQGCPKAGAARENLRSMWGYIRLYAGPLPPSRGVHRGPMTSVALQSTQFGAFTTSRSPSSS